MSPGYVIVDVSTDTPLRGNQLAVLEDGSALSDDQMQRLAREMNLSENNVSEESQVWNTTNFGSGSRH